MPIVIGAVAPHGFPIIPEISDDAEGALATREAMLEMGRRFAAANIDTLFITGPHGIRTNGAVSLSDCGSGAGTLFWGDRKVELNVPFDLDFSRLVAEKARARSVPVVQVGYGGSDPRASVYPMDWGVMTPAWFAGHSTNQPGMGHVLAGLLGKVERSSGPPLVVAQPSRLIPREVNVEFGRAVAEAANESGKRVGFIASCDWAHSHSESGPYGFHPDAKRMDDLVVQAIKDDDIMSLIDLDDEFVRNAAIDGLWQLLMLEGARQVTPMAIDFLCYEAPTYYGMIVATYEPAGEA
jgi:aromatic ring-opening dioxygenase LigB subunit